MGMPVLDASIVSLFFALRSQLSLASSVYLHPKVSFLFLFFVLFPVMFPCWPCYTHGFLGGDLVSRTRFCDLPPTSELLKNPDQSSVWKLSLWMCQISTLVSWPALGCLASQVMEWIYIFIPVSGLSVVKRFKWLSRKCQYGANITN